MRMHGHSTLPANARALLKHQGKGSRCCFTLRTAKLPT